MTSYFRLTSSQNQYNEFVFGTDSFILEFKLNKINKRYYMSVYKNNELVVKSIKVVWSNYNLFSSFKYKNIGELKCISGAFNLLADNKTKELQELTNTNITSFIFEWIYNTQ